MDYIFEKDWKETLGYLEERFDQPVDLQAALFLIGVQELGHGFRKFKKDDKVALMHVAICTLLEPLGFYEFIGRDDDGWPHFKRKQALPVLKASEQELIVKKAIIGYFNPDKTDE